MKKHGNECNTKKAYQQDLLERGLTHYRNQISVLCRFTGNPVERVMHMERFNRMLAAFPTLIHSPYSEEQIEEYRQQIGTWRKGKF